MADLSGRLSIAGLAVAAALGLAISLLPLTWSGTLVLGATAGILILLKPQLGLLLIVAAVPFGSLRQVQMGGMSVGLAEVLVALTLGAWCVRMISRREIRVAFGPLALPLLFFLATLVLSLVSATSLQHGLKEVVKWLEVLALYLFVTNEVDDRWARALVSALLGVGALAALQGIHQFLLGVGPDSFVLFGRFMRAYGTFEQPNPYGGYLGLVLPLAAGLALAAILRVGGRIRWAWLAWACGCGALIATALIMSWSRGAWLGMAAAAAAIVLAVVARSGRATVLAVVLVVLVTYALLAGGLARVPPSIVQRFSDLVPFLGSVDVRGSEITDANFAVLERMAHWQAAWGMWTDHPWLGVGIGNFEPVYAAYSLPAWPLPLGHAHNYYLNIAAETGVVGLAAYMLLWATAIVGAWRAAARSQPGWRWGVALGILGVVVHLSVHNLFDNLYVHSMYLHLAILLGLLPVLSGRPRSERR